MESLARKGKYIWEVKSQSEASSAYKESHHYVETLQNAGKNVEDGWDIGGPYPYSDNSGKNIVYGKGPGAVIYTSRIDYRDNRQAGTQPGPASEAEEDKGEKILRGIEVFEALEEIVLESQVKG
jgi:hypothetical protein